MKCRASGRCFKTRISQSCYLIPSDELESGPSSAQRESTPHELLPNIISAISPLSWTSEHGKNVELEINTSEYHGRVFETGGFIFMFSSLFFVFQRSFWHIYVLSWAQAVLLPYRLSIVSFSLVQKRISIQQREREKKIQTQRKMEWKGDYVYPTSLLFMPLIFSWGQCFIQIDFFKPNSHVLSVQDGSLHLSVCS